MKLEPARNAKHFLGSAKAEPLKDKCIIIGIDDLDDYLNDLNKLLKKTFKYPQLHHYEFYPAHYVSSAVEWLKDKTTHTFGCEKMMKEGVKCRCDYNERIKLIDKAFEDAIKK